MHGLLAGSGDRIELTPAERAHAARLVESFDRLVVDSSDRAQMIVVFRDFDVSYRQRRINRVVYLLHDLLFGPAIGLRERRGDYQTLLQVLNRQSKAYEIVLAAMESLVDGASLRLDDEAKVTPEAIWLGVSSWFHTL